MSFTLHLHPHTTRNTQSITHPPPLFLASDTSVCLHPTERPLIFSVGLLLDASDSLLLGIDQGNTRPFDLTHRLFTPPLSIGTCHSACLKPCPPTFPTSLQRRRLPVCASRIQLLQLPLIIQPRSGSQPNATQRTSPLAPRHRRAIT